MQSTFATGIRAFGIALDHSGNLFVANVDPDTIIKVSSDGSKSILASGVYGAEGLAFDKAGNLFVADYHSHSILKFTPEGKKSTFATGLRHPAYLMLDDKGNLFVADLETDSIFKFTPSGVRSTFASGLNPEAMTFDKAGNLFVADRHSIFKFSPKGAKTTFAAGIPWFIGFAFDKAGNLFVADSATDSVLKFTSDGTKSTFAAPPPSASSAEEAESPSPDGKFAFRISYGEDLRTIDLIDAKSAKVVFRVAETDESQTYWHVLWAPDSKRFALMTRLGHPIQGVSVYAKSGDTFHEVELPELPEANIPDRLKRGKEFPHVANSNWQEASKWTKDGSLVVTVDTMVDGGGDGSITATRTVVLGFDRSGKARIMKSTIKFETEKSE